MTDISNYRETPRTGRTPAYSAHEAAPDAVDPSVLTDDRSNSDLLVFEKTWGHRLLAGIGIAMLVIAIVLTVFCIVQLMRLMNIAALAPGVGTMGLYFFGTGLAAGILLIIPAAVAIYVAKRPAKVNAAIVMAVLGIVVALAFFGYAVSTAPQFILQAVLYTLLFALFPIVYLIAALKIKRS